MSEQDYLRNAFVVGNGESRRGLDLRILTPHGRVWGCNALYRDFSPDRLIVMDEEITREVIRSGYAKDHVVYARHRDRFPGNTLAKGFPQPGTKNWSAGPAATFMACFEGGTLLKSVFLIGFDLYGAGKYKNRHNNVYKGTDCYRGAKASATEHRNWVKHLAQVMRTYDGVLFYWVGGSKELMPEEWSGIHNLKSLGLSTLIYYVLSLG